MSESTPVRGADKLARTGRRARGLNGALELMTEALDILDREKAPTDIGARLDMAIQRLRDVIGLSN